MAGTINSLGIGSNVLTSDVIDKLKANDKSILINPIENKIALQKQKGEALKLLNSLLSSFKSSVNALGNSTLYQARSVSGNSSSINVTANAGVSVQSFTLSDIQMAQKSVKESGSFLSLNAPVASGNGSMNIGIGGLSFTIDYTSGMSMSDLKDAINAQAGSKVVASTLQVGENDYRLILRSVDTGTDQNITLSDNDGALSSALLPYDISTNPSGMQEIQAASDASFKYNGINLKRSSNTISDIIPGVTINLLQDNASSSTISISQDTNAITEEMKMLVESYNTLTSQLKNMTLADVEEGKIGIFNGESSINMIGREITRMMTSINNGYSLTKFGIDLNQNGNMTFNANTFTEQFNQNPSLSENFLSGTTLGQEGIFAKLDNLMNSYTKSDGVLNTLTTGSDTELKSLNENKKRAQALLDARYEAMTARFIQYDAIISKINLQFSSLQQQIQMAINAK